MTPSANALLEPAAPQSGEERVPPLCGGNEDIHGITPMWKRLLAILLLLLLPSLSHAQEADPDKTFAPSVLQWLIAVISTALVLLVVCKTTKKS